MLPALQAQLPRSGMDSRHSAVASLPARSGMTEVLMLSANHKRLRLTKTKTLPSFPTSQGAKRPESVGNPCRNAEAEPAVQEAVLILSAFVLPLIRHFVTPSPRKRGEGGRPHRPLPCLLPACGEKVPEGRMRGSADGPRNRLSDGESGERTAV